MGSKNLKAIAVRGTGAIPIVDKAAFNTMANESVALCASVDRRPGFRLLGTAQSLDENHFYTGSLATNNYQKTWFPDITRLGAEEAARIFWQRHVACMGCQIHCMKFGVIRDSEKYLGLVAEGPEYESGVMEGSNLGVGNFDDMMHLIEKCDALGMDNVGAGNVTSFAMELMQRGIIKPSDIDGIDLQFGNADAASQFMDAIAYKKGNAAKLFGDGVYDASQRVGKGSDRYAMLCKRQGFAAHDPRGDRSRMYTYALGPRGGVHTDGGSTNGIINSTIYGAVCMCYFVPTTWGKRSMSLLIDMINPLCGWDMTLEELQLMGKRILILQRAYSHREGGITRKDDVLPTRMYEEPLPEGPKKGAVVTREEMKKAQDSHYSILGWDDDGVPSDETLKKYGLDFVIADMRAKK